MRLPKGASYRFIWSEEGRALLSTKNTSLDTVLDELATQFFTGYIRITVERADVLEDGYLLLSFGKLVGAEYDGRETLVGALGLDASRRAWEGEGIVDLYEFNETQLRFALEENSAALLVSMDEITEGIEAGRDGKQEFDQRVEAEEEATREAKRRVEEAEAAAVEEEKTESCDSNDSEVERAALLAKLGLKDPGEDFAEAVLQCFILPSDGELRKESHRLKLEILRALKKKKRFKELDLYITPSRQSEAVLFEIDVYVKPLKKGASELVKTTIDSVFESDVSFPFERKISISEG
ncbi:hypothetical protein BMS3Bbin16_00294 [archaeon BMS3Bbin16]|nr:hypothetical protein BMS3Bbin16_00294 [archaeon BMS3Bbin16]